MIKKIWLTIFLMILSDKLMACPMCVGDNPNDKYYLWVIGVFVLLIYIPMFYLFKTLMKHKDINKIEKSDLPNEQ